MRRITNLYVLTALACTGGLMFGINIISLGAIISSPNYLTYFGEPEQTVECPDRPGALCNPGPSANVQGGITASMAGGSFVASLFSGLVSDRFGRRYAIFLGCILWVIGSILTCAVQNIGMLIIGRIFNGLCVGLTSAQVPVYISEMSPSSIRGRLAGCQQLAIMVGICLFFWLCFLGGLIGRQLDGQQDGRRTASFRVPWGLQVIPAIVLMSLLPFMSESPRWLMTKGRSHEALEILAQVRAKGDEDAPEIQAEFKEIAQEIEETSGDGADYIDLFRHGNAWRTHVAICMHIWSQLTGLNVITFYLVYVFEMAGLTGQIALILNGVQYIINALVTVPALLYMDRRGRRATLLVGSTFMAIFLFAVAGLMSAYGRYTDTSSNAVVRWKVEGLASRAVIASCYLFGAAYSMTYGPVSMVLPSELLGNRLRGKGNSVATASNWAFNFALGYFVPPAFHNIQWKTYVIFGCFCVAMTIHVFLAFPETAGKSLEEVDEIFQNRTPAWKTQKGPGKPAHDTERAMIGAPVFTQQPTIKGSPTDEKHSKF